MEVTNILRLIPSWFFEWIEWYLQIEWVCEQNSFEGLIKKCESEEGKDVKKIFCNSELTEQIIAAWLLK